MSGTRRAYWLPLAVTMRPVPVSTSPSCTPAWSRSRDKVGPSSAGGVSASSTAIERAFLVSSESCESSDARASTSPESSARSSGTSNQDSIERPTNWTATKKTSATGRTVISTNEPAMRAIRRVPNKPRR